MNDNLKGALWMMASMAGFVINDTFMKSLAGEVPLFQAIFLRGIVATTLIGLLAWHRGAFRTVPARTDRRIIGWRTLGEIGGTTLFLTALFNMPIANATAILQTTPLTVTLAAALILGDPVGWRRYLAIAIGFVGVLLIVRPGAEGFNIYALSALGAVVFITLRDVATRQLSPTVPSLMVTTATALAITIFGGIAATVTDWRPVEMEALLKLAASALFLLVGYYAGVAAMRVGDVGTVSPFRYTNIVWAILLGWWIFGELPGLLTLAGVAIVCATGLYTLHRARLSDSKGQAPNPPRPTHPDR